MTTVESPEKALFASTTQAFLQKEAPLTYVRELHAAGVSFDRAWWRRAAELGWTGLVVPEELGGGAVSGSGIADLAMVAELIGNTVAPGPLYPVSTVLCALVECGEHDAHAGIIESLMSGETVASWAVYEPGRGWAPLEPSVTATPHNSGYRIDGVKDRVEAGAESDVLLVVARSDGDDARTRRDIVAITAAMPGPTGLTPFGEQFPDRLFDVGIAEQHAMTSAAGLAMGGMHPVVAIYSTFLNRGFDQIMMDVALHKLPVTMVLDRAGVTGSDGASHNGMWDLSMLGIVPGMRVAAPRDAARLREELGEALDVDDGPTALRFPKGDVGEDIPALERRGSGLAAVDVLAATDTPGRQEVVVRLQVRWLHGDWRLVAPPGPAMPVIDTERLAGEWRSAPSAIARATSSLTAPTLSSTACGTPSSACLASFE